MRPAGQPSRLIVPAIERSGLSEHWIDVIDRVMTHASLYDTPALYDRIVVPGPCEAFYDALAGRARGPVLDLACGTGRLTIPLALRGHAMTGVDASPAMLELARRKAVEHGLAVPFWLGDMRSFALGRRFPLVIITCNSLAHLADGQDLASCLACVARHLEPGGLLAFDVVRPDVDILSRCGSGPVRLDRGPNPATAIAIEEQASYDPIRQVRELRWRVLEPGAGEIAALSLRQFFPQEVPLLLQAAGLALVERHGDFDGGPLTARSLNQVCVARLAPHIG